ncbi:MAG: hypothetical protein NTV11_10820 [Rhodocyclales bacterium]|nr:hypothetical protein [Rhodocyclales bacterium]
MIAIKHALPSAAPVTANPDHRTDPPGALFGLTCGVRTGAFP